MSTDPDLLRTWRVADRVLSLGQFPLLMGIVNATPDSFSDGGQFLDPERAVEHARTLVSQGADIIDIGGESTRPGSDSVAPSEQLRRVIPVVSGLAQQSDVLISIDTTSAEVAREALAAGAHIVNDISGLTFDEQMVPLVANADCGVICMHIQGTPKTMQDAPCYEDVVPDICRFLEARLSVLEKAGVDPQRVVLDPGIGFGKTAAHNLEILSSVGQLRSLGRPVLIGHSRKRFLEKILGRELDERTWGTVGVSVALAAQRADILRVHDVLAVRDAVLAWHTVMSTADSPD
ncbi:Dihydropteroate synthase [Maioricimonas rarisocia]|uniref:Dihydropteroate synthase n=1 Tax=Maioricimonas rarisocia TaxID=2528026 RepID=A0A517Z456_9PLAN|nr:dihydropteroate synthase [Maioricimonas rarisocia]QDU37225.1 Dihydropteroate synthase [Maioricimonas rarisocia]